MIDPQLFQLICFYAFGAVTVLAALGVITLKNSVHAARACSWPPLAPTDRMHSHYRPTSRLSSPPCSPCRVSIAQLARWHLPGGTIRMYRRICAK